MNERIKTGGLVIVGLAAAAVGAWGVLTHSAEARDALQPTEPLCRWVNTGDRYHPKVCVAQGPAVDRLSQGDFNAVLAQCPDIGREVNGLVVTPRQGYQAPEVLCYK